MIYISFRLIWISCDLVRPAFSEEFEKAEEELQKLFGEYFIHVRCLDTLRAQMSANIKTAQAISEPMSKSSAPPSMILPDGILDFSDELSNDGDELLDDDELKLKRISESILESNDGKAENKPESDPGKSKLRVRTGGKNFFVNVLSKPKALIEFNF